MNIENLHKDWIELGGNYTSDLSFLESLWKIIIQNYQHKNRYYHNLNHIYFMLQLAKENASQITDFNNFLLAVWFHDVIYKSSKKNNEEKSAEFAVSALIKMGAEKRSIHEISQLIISTKSHQIILNENNDNAFLLDFDLSILGQDWSIYKTYIQKIRKEYKIYPNFLYNPARKKVLHSFLNRNTLYFTKKYQNLFEKTARENLKKELEILS